MPPKRVEWIDRIREVEREFIAICLGAQRLLADARNDPGVLADEALRPRDELTTTQLLRQRLERELCC